MPAAGVAAVPAAAATAYSVVAAVRVGSAPFAVGVDPATSTIYVANSGSYSVSVIDVATNTIIIITTTTTTDVGNTPYAVG